MTDVDCGAGFARTCTVGGPHAGGHGADVAQARGPVVAARQQQVTVRRVHVCARDLQPGAQRSDTAACSPMQPYGKSLNVSSKYAQGVAAPLMPVEQCVIPLGSLQGTDTPVSNSPGPGAKPVCCKNTIREGFPLCLAMLLPCCPSCAGRPQPPSSGRARPQSARSRGCRRR